MVGVQPRDSRALVLSERRRRTSEFGGAEAGGILADGEVGFVEDAEDGFGYLTYGYFGAGSEVEFLT